MAVNLADGAGRHGEVARLIARAEDIAVAAVVERIGNWVTVGELVDSAADHAIAGKLEIPHQVRHLGRAVGHRNPGQRVRRHGGPKSRLEGLVTVYGLLE